jgi:hypothetical protein
MFLRHLDFLFVPFRKIYNQVLQVRNVKGSIHMDVNRAKSMGKRGKDAAARSKQQAGKLLGQGGQFPGQGQGHAPGGPSYHQGAMQPGGNAAGGGAGAASGAAGGQGVVASPAIATRGFWIFKKKYCTQCSTQLDRTWDRCPFCAQIAAQASAPRPVLKTQAFSMDPTGRPGQNQMLGWLVPLQGPSRGELYTLSPLTVVGNDPGCTVVLADRYMSGKHAEIKVENGVWVLKDLGSTNGTYVNNRRVDKHELVDNDFIKFGGAMVKFKCLS